jgi:hypothetical protein
MSANYDKNQKFKFVSENVYQINPQNPANQNSEAQPKSNPIAKTIKTSGIIKAEDLKKSAFATVRVNPYTAAEMIGKRVARPNYLPPLASPAGNASESSGVISPAASAVLAPTTAATQNAALKNMRDNLKVLQDLQSRLRFVLTELESLIDE